MMRMFQQSYHIAGTLAANIDIRFKLPCDCSLVHVSAVASNDSDATLKIGTSTDDDAYLAASAIGDSNVPVERDRDDFVGGQFPHVTRGTSMAFALDFDGAAGTAAQNVTFVATFLEG